MFPSSVPKHVHLTDEYYVVYCTEILSNYSIDVSDYKHIIRIFIWRFFQFKKEQTKKILPSEFQKYNLSCKKMGLNSCHKPFIQVFFGGVGK